MSCQGGTKFTSPDLKKKRKKLYIHKSKEIWPLSGEADAFILIFVSSGNCKFGQKGNLGLCESHPLSCQSLTFFECFCQCEDITFGNFVFLYQGVPDLESLLLFLLFGSFCCAACRSRFLNMALTLGIFFLGAFGGGSGF